ncbi:YveK family protein [Thalassobacillus sp. CUG 92003]|uniref:YveK family protein n=1 Tax=Thalassobacillus sp. CUG 92003 TaxID=2736641 RepID=UPI0015E653C9|nr:Wzz/FepE/Etk N-terminal domain-containing protein [Thalassobacillus sp. CUG 92003]
MDIKTFFRIIKRRMATILITAICVSLLSGVAVFYFLKPTYEATEYILVGNLGHQEEVYVEPQTINRLIASTVDFITSPIVLESVQGDMNLPQEELEEKITIKNKENSQIISVVIRDTDAERASELANLLAATSVEEVKDSMQMENIALLSKKDGINKVEEVGGSTVNILIGMMVGLFCGIGLAMLKDHWDDSVQSLKQIENELGLPVLGEVEATSDSLPKYYRKQYTSAKGKVKKGGKMHAESH